MPHIASANLSYCYDSSCKRIRVTVWGHEFIYQMQGYSVSSHRIHEGKKNSDSTPEESFIVVNAILVKVPGASRSVTFSELDLQTIVREFDCRCVTYTSDST